MQNFDSLAARARFVPEETLRPALEAYRVWNYYNAPDVIKAIVDQMVDPNVGHAERPKWIVYVPARHGDKPSWTDRRHMLDEKFIVVQGGKHSLSLRELQHQDTILVWPYADVPAHLKEIANTGGDEDWLALVPSFMTRDEISWMQEGSAFGRSVVKDVELPDGDGAVLRIGSH